MKCDCTAATRRATVREVSRHFSRPWIIHDSFSGLGRLGLARTQSRKSKVMPMNKILAIASTVIAAVPRAGTFSPARREAPSCELKLQPPTYDTRRFDDGPEVHAFALRIQKAVNLTAAAGLHPSRQRCLGDLPRLHFLGQAFYGFVSSLTGVGRRKGGIRLYPRLGTPCARRARDNLIASATNSTSTFGFFTAMFSTSSILSSLIDRDIAFSPV